MRSGYLRGTALFREERLKESEAKTDKTVAYRLQSRRSGSPGGVEAGPKVLVAGKSPWLPDDRRQDALGE